MGTTYTGTVVDIEGKTITPGDFILFSDPLEGKRLLRGQVKEIINSTTLKLVEPAIVGFRKVWRASDPKTCVLREKCGKLEQEKEKANG